VDALIALPETGTGYARSAAEFFKGSKSLFAAFLNARAIAPMSMSLAVADARAPLQAAIRR